MKTFWVLLLDILSDFHDNSFVLIQTPKRKKQGMIKQTCSTRKKYTIPHQELEPNPLFSKTTATAITLADLLPNFQYPYFSHMSEVNLDNVIDPLTSRCDSCVTSPFNIHTLFGKQVMRILKLIRWEFFSWSNIKFSQPISVEMFSS